MMPTRSGPVNAVLTECSSPWGAGAAATESVNRDDAEVLGAVRSRDDADSWESVNRDGRRRAGDRQLAAMWPTREESVNLLDPELLKIFIGAAMRPTRKESVSEPS
jgi:hypothetical protein